MNYLETRSELFLLWEQELWPLLLQKRFLSYRTQIRDTYFKMERDMKQLVLENTVENLEDIVNRSTVITVDSSLALIGTVKRLRAAKLILNGKGYELIRRSDEAPNSNLTDLIGDPLVLALNRYVPKRKLEVKIDSPVSKRMILSRDGYVCSYCGGFGNTVDHIIPKSKGGPSTWGNLTTACRDCNGKKGDLELTEIGYKAPRIPKSFIPQRHLLLQEAVHQRLATMSY